jgi:hypothetical protein
VYEDEFGDFNRASRTQWWLFDTHPYAKEALQLSERSPSLDGSAAKPFILYPVNGYDVGMVRTAVMAQFIDDADAVWDDASKTATVTGFNKYGEDLVIVLTQGNSTATINGVSVDIADYSGSASSGSCTVLNVNDAIYLPARFVIKAYGGTAHWDDASKTATFYK